jgi:Fe-Mn family superoxide dismutase
MPNLFVTDLVYNSENHMDRRSFLSQTAVAGLFWALLPEFSWAKPFLGLSDTGFTQAPLPYPFDALEPYIDARTMEIHYTKHHAAYVKNLNDALASSQLLATASGSADFLTHVQALPENVRQKIRNNGGGHLNHTLFWQLLSPQKDQQPSGALAEALKSTFGSVADFQKKFSEAGKSVFGSGWVWLIQTPDRKLEIITTPNQDYPLMDFVPVKGKPILGLDVWEHAYYLKYQNRRAEYIDAFWHIVNWKMVAELFAH